MCNQLIEEACGTMFVVPHSGQAGSPPTSERTRSREAGAPAGPGSVRSKGVQQQGQAAGPGHEGKHGSQPEVGGPLGNLDKAKQVSLPLPLPRKPQQQSTQLLESILARSKTLHRMDALAPATRGGGPSPADDFLLLDSILGALR